MDLVERGPARAYVLSSWSPALIRASHVSMWSETRMRQCSAHECSQQGYGSLTGQEGSDSVVAESREQVVVL